MAKDIEAKKKREQYEAKIRIAANLKNVTIQRAKETYMEDVKKIRKEIYG